MSKSIRFMFKFSDDDISRYVDAEEKPIMEEMIETIRESFGEVIAQSEWMDDDTRSVTSYRSRIK